MTGTSAVPTSQDLDAVSPALRHFTECIVQGELWDRVELSARDRSVVTLAVVIARNQAVQISTCLEVALRNEVKPAEISEIRSHRSLITSTVQWITD